MNFKCISKSTNSTVLHEYCDKHSFYRGMPTKEQKACDTIIDCIDNVLPRGGESVYAGTPTAFSKAMANNIHSKQILYDNLLVADRLRRTSDHMSMLIGNAVNKEKAIEKATLWSRLQYMNRVTIKVGPVTGPTFGKEIDRIAKKCELVKVILMTSGSWEGTSSKYKLDLNFKDRAITLSRLYPNLHILAMITQRWSMSVLYVYRGNIKQI